MGTGSLSRGNAAEKWRWSHTPSRAKVKERVELYLYTPSGLHDLFHGELFIRNKRKGKGHPTTGHEGPETQYFL